MSVSIQAFFSFVVRQIFPSIYNVVSHGNVVQAKESRVER